MPNEAQEREVLMMVSSAGEGMMSESHKSGSVCERVTNTHMYATDEDEDDDDDDDDGASHHGGGEENGSGKTLLLREHDYIGLSEMSSSSAASSFQSVQQSPSSRGRRRDGDGEGGGEELNLNLGATELRLGPLPDLMESGRGGGGERGGGSCLEKKKNSTTDQLQQQQTHHVVVSDRGVAAAAAAEKQLEEQPPSVDSDNGKKKDSFRSDESLSLGIGLLANPRLMGNPNNMDVAAAVADKKLFFYRSEGPAAMEDNQQSQSNQQQKIPHPQQQQNSHELLPFSNARTSTSWAERNHQCSSSTGVVQQEDSSSSPVSDMLLDRTSMAGRGHHHHHHHHQQPNKLDRPKQELLLQESNSVPKMQGAQAPTASKFAPSPPATSATHVPMHPSSQQPSSSSLPPQQQQAEKRYPPQEPQYPQENILGELDRNGIVQEFNAHKLKVQMRQAAAAESNGSQFWLAKPENHHHHLPPQLSSSSSSSPQEPPENSRAINGGAPQTGLSRGMTMFPPSKTGVGGAKRGFSEAIGNSGVSEPRNPYPDGRNAFVEGGASSREGPIGGASARINGGGGTEMLSQQQSKHQQLAATTPPPPSAAANMYPCSNNPKQPSPSPSWQQQSLEQSGVYFGPFRSQRPARGSSGGPLSSSNGGADASAIVSVNVESSNPKAWETTTTWSTKNLQQVTVHASSEMMSKHPSPPDTRSLPVKESAAPTSAPPPPPRQNQVVGWPPVRNFRKNQQPPKPASQDRQPRSSVSTTPQATTTTNTTTSATPPKAPANSGGTPSQTSSLLVKVYMDGLPIGRKVDLVINNSYDKLKSALEDLFQQFIGQPGSIQSGSTGGLESGGLSSSCNRKLNFLHSSEYVLTYEDCESDLMLVGDVPWNMFTGIVRRLRIMKGVDIARNGGDNTMNSQLEVD